MNVPSRRTAGASRRAASKRSLSKTRVRGWTLEVRGWGSATSTPAAPPAPPAMGFFTCYP